MTTKRTTTLLCDNPHRLHRPGSEVPAAVTRKLRWNGLEYETDLCAPDSKTLDAVLAQFVKAARRVVPPKRKQAPRSTAHREKRAAVRAWAKEAGRVVGDRGRLPVSVWAEYERAVAGRD